MAFPPRAIPLPRPRARCWGLGLSLARKVVQEMGGELSYNRAHTDGAQLLITLPSARWA